MKEVSVSFLKDGNYKDYIESINKSHADYIHFDVMDGNFVDRKNLLPSELTNYLSLSKKKNDIHLMVSNPLKYIEKISLYNIDYITVHYEVKNFIKCIDVIKKYGFKSGVAVNPETDISHIFPILDKINLVLIMGVHPGKSGQTFIDGTSLKINKLREEIVKRGLNVKIEVDGGVCEEILDEISCCDIIVSASYLLDDLDRIDLLKSI